MNFKIQMLAGNEIENLCRCQFLNKFDFSVLYLDRLFQICHILPQNWTSKKVWWNWWNTSMIYMKDWATWFVLNCFGFCGSVWNYLEWPWQFCLMTGPIWSLYLPLQSWFILVTPFIGIIWVEELRLKDEFLLKSSMKNVCNIRERLTEVIFKSIKPYDLWGIRHTMNALALL